jgi:integrase
MLRRYVCPALGKIRVREVRRDDVERLHATITRAGYQRRANAVLVLVRVLFNVAIGWDWCEVNPTKGIQRNPGHARERYLTEAETARLIAQLDRRREQRPDSVDAIRLALLTGARRGELTKMRWADLDLEQGVWVKPHPTTKQRKLHRVPLAADAVAVLRRRLAERGNVRRLDDFVFAGGGSKNHVRALERDWELVRAACGLDDVHFHDLRHSHASMLVAEGLSLPIIGALLGHARPQTTARYAHLADQPLRAAAELVAAKLRR